MKSLDLIHISRQIRAHEVFDLEIKFLDKYVILRHYLSIDENLTFFNEIRQFIDIFSDKLDIFHSKSIESLLTFLKKLSIKKINFNFEYNPLLSYMLLDEETLPHTLSVTAQLGSGFGAYIIFHIMDAYTNNLVYKKTKNENYNKNLIIFSKTKTHYICAILSSQFHDFCTVELNKEKIPIMPYVTFKYNEQETECESKDFFNNDNIDETHLTFILATIMRFSPFKTIQDLENQFKNIKTDVGIHLVFYQFSQLEIAKAISNSVTNRSFTALKPIKIITKKNKLIIKYDFLKYFNNSKFLNFQRRKFKRKRNKYNMQIKDFFATAKHNVQTN